MTIDCKEWTPHPNGHGYCAAGKFGGRPSLGTCRACLAGTITDTPHDGTEPPPLTEEQMVAIDRKPCSSCRGL